MARSLSAIYKEAKKARDARLELTEFHNGSKMSIMDAFTWVVAACIWSFENILDVFKIDVATDLQYRVNGTPAYYVNALLKYQDGDKLVMNEDGTQFHYPTIDETKRIVTRVSYSEESNDLIEDINGVRTVYKFFDKDLVLKIATGTPGNYAQIDGDKLNAIRAYMQQIAFAGTHMTIRSRKGDVLVPKVIVYYDGGVSESEMMTAIEKALSEYLAALSFDGVVYVQKIIDVLQRVDHVTDVYIDHNSPTHNGIFVAQYNDDNNFYVDDDGNVLQRIDRFLIPNSGFLRQSTAEDGLPQWKDTIRLIVEKPNTGFLSE